MKILLIRHAKTTSNHGGRYMGRLDEGLPPASLPTAALVAERLADEGIGAIYTSPLSRARQTAEPTAARLGLPVSAAEAFNEMDMGPWEGLTASEIAAKFPEEWRIWRDRPADLQLLGRETLPMVQERAITGIKQVLEVDLQVVAIFTHDVIVRLVLAHALGFGAEIYRKIPSANCGISSIVSDKAGLLTVELMNETHFLSKLS